MFVAEEASLSGGSAEPRGADGGEGAAAGELPLERLEHEIVQLASNINAGSCRWLELVAEFDRRRGWASWSCRSCAEWVAWRCALDPRSAREHVRVARSLAGVPRIHAAFARGQLSYSKVRALTRDADADSEAELLELAEHATAAQLDRIVRGLRRISTEDSNEAHASRHLSLWWEGDGSLSFHGNLPPEQGAALMAALDAMHDLIRATATDTRAGDASGSAEPLEGDGSSEPPSSSDRRGSAEPRPSLHPPAPSRPDEPRVATNADALCAMAESALSARPGADRPGGERCELVVHVDAETLARSQADRDGPGADVAARPGSARIEDGSALAPETIRRLACDCSFVSLLEGADGGALSVGRRRRSVPLALARALRARDGTCAFPGCESRRFLDAHHIVHWAHGGETSADNLVRLCRRHHRLLHEGGCSLERLPAGELRFRDSRGRPLSCSPPAPPGSAEAIPAGESELHPGSGERLDLALTLSAAASASRPSP